MLYESIKSVRRLAVQLSSWRQASPLSPINRHIGLYAYKREALERFTQCDESQYETLEGLEQLRLLENGMTIECVHVEPANIATSGIDSPADIELYADMGILLIREMLLPA